MEKHHLEVKGNINVSVFSEMWHSYMKGYIQLQNYIHFNNLEETYRNFKSLENFFFPVLFAKMKTPGRFA